MDTNGRGRRRFGNLEFDTETRKLFRNGQPVKIQPQPLRVLELLLERPGEIIPREELRSRIWGETTFIEFDQALNYCIRQIRIALRDGAAEPSFIETLPKQGYRFIARVGIFDGHGTAHFAEGTQETADVQVHAPAVAVAPAAHNQRAWVWLALLSGVVVAGVTLHLARPRHRTITYTQLTDFTDSAVAPALSADGRMLAFIRGGNPFLSADQIYLKILPNGEPKRLTNDGRLKYGLAFSPDGSQIAYTALEGKGFSTYTVPALGGDSHLFLKNAAGLGWLDGTHLLFSAIRSGIHLGIVTATVTGDRYREIYFPAHERGMAHYSYPSPDLAWALVVEMLGTGEWGPCKLIPLRGNAQPRSIGPDAACTAAGWSPDGVWMYLVASMHGQSHIWRQRFPDGKPEQLTSGPAEEDGLAVEKDGKSVITSVGVRESAVWIHDGHGDRPLSSEGRVVDANSPPSFSGDSKILYYLLQRGAAGVGAELWRTQVDSGESEPVLPGLAMLEYAISADGKQLVYSSVESNGKPQLWLAPMDRSAPPRKIGDPGANSPHFGPRGQIWFRLAEGNSNYLERMNQDGSARSKVLDYPIVEIQGISPGRRWMMAVIPFAEGRHVGVVAIPVSGGPPRLMCSGYCAPVWSPNGKYLFVQVEPASRTSSGRSLAIPVGPEESLPAFPPGGIAPLSDASVVAGAQCVTREDFVPGNDLNYYAYVNTSVQRNLYRVSLP